MNTRFKFTFQKCFRISFSGVPTSGGTQVTSTTSVKITANQTLYARWEAKKIVVTLDANSGSVSPTSIEVLLGNTYGDLPTPVCGSHEFEGWYLEETWENKIISTTSVTKDIDHEIHAKWKNILPKLQKTSTSAMGSYFVTYYVVDEDGDNLYYKYVNAKGEVPDEWTSVGSSRMKLGSSQGSLTYQPSNTKNYYIFTDGIDIVYINT